MVEFETSVNFERGKFYTSKQFQKLQKSLNFTAFESSNAF